MSDTDTGTALRTPMFEQCHFFFASLTQCWHGTDTPAMEKKKKNSRFWQMDKSLLLILWYILEWEVRNLTSETHIAQPLISFCPSLVLHWANRQVSKLPLSLCPFQSLSLSRRGQIRASLLSLFRDFFFSFIFWLLWTFFGVLWRLLFKTPKAFFF